jgi:hypothetical protein
MRWEFIAERFWPQSGRTLRLPFASPLSRVIVFFMPKTSTIRHGTQTPHVQRQQLFKTKAYISIHLGDILSCPRVRKISNSTTIMSDLFSEDQGFTVFLDVQVLLFSSLQLWAYKAI